MNLPEGEVVNKNSINILTDIHIPQSKIWRDRTKYIKDLFPHLKIQIDGFESYKEILYYLWRFVTSMRHYDVIVTADIKLAQLVALYRFLFFIRKPKQIIPELMLDEEASGLLWKLKVKFQRLLFLPSISYSYRRHARWKPTRGDSDPAGEVPFHPFPYEHHQSPPAGKTRGSS
jgi:hypothetical protein